MASPLKGYKVFASFGGKFLGYRKSLTSARKLANAKSKKQPVDIWTTGDGMFGQGKVVEHISSPPSKNPELGQKAFAAGSDWWHVGQHTAGVANARVVRYGFLKWWNNTSPAETEGHSKSYLEKAFREGWTRGKRGPQRIPNGRMVPARIKVGRKTYPGMAKKVNGRVKIFVTPGVARKINPQALKLRIVFSGMGYVVEGGTKQKPVIFAGPYRTKYEAIKKRKEIMKRG